MSVYKINLIPMERFFFGGEDTFGTDNKENYFVRSLFLPQQTTLLGFLRFVLLKNYNLMDDNGKIIPGKEAEANGKIGKSGFNVNNNKNDYGYIKELSPVFITGPNSDFIIQSREFGLNWIEDEVSGEIMQGITPLFYTPKNGLAYQFGYKRSVPFLVGLESKTIIPDMLLDINSGMKRYFLYNPLEQGNSMSGIYIEDEQIGIRKKREKTDDIKKGLYKQIGYNMIEGYGFSFYAVIDGDEIKNFKEVPMKMGTDQSWFKVTINKVSDDTSVNNCFLDPLKGLFEFPNSLSGKIILLSDTYVEQTFFENINFAISSTYIFKFMTTRKLNENDPFKNIKGNFSMIKNASSYELIRRGSVLFVDYSKKEEILNIISPQEGYATSFNQIGYNYAI